MQMVKNIFLIFLVVWFALLVFMPKEELYFTLEKELAKQDIEINEKKIEEGAFSLNLIEATIYVKGIKVATVQKVNVFTLLFYTNINLTSLLLDESLSSFAPKKIDVANVSYSIVNPFYVNIEAEGSFGLLKGIVNLNERNLRIDFMETTKDINSIKSNLKKDEKGLYFETSF
jgi:uncharacterized membrane protein